MGALPRPQVPDGPIRVFFDELHDLHHRAGWPSLRDMAKEVGCSHTTVSVAFSGASVPRWGLLELIVETLDGDTSRFHELWLTASSAAGSVPGSGSPPAMGSVPVPVPAPLSVPVPRGGGAGSEPTTPPTPPAPRQLPADVAAFTGREAQLAAMDRLLAEAAADTTAVMLLAVTGTAGVGKTALAVHWAHRVATAFPDGQLYLDLRGYHPERPMESAEALEVMLRALGMDGAAIPHRLDERAARYRTLLADRTMLVLLDNAHSVSQIRDLLPGSPSCSVLVTSRSALPALVVRHGAVRVNLDVLAVDEAVALLRRLIGPRLDAEPDQAIALAERCARLPLALRIAAELAVARPAAPISRLVGELGDESRRLDLLATGDDDDYTTVRTVFSWSSRHLPDAAVSAFQLLGLHPGRDFDVAAAAALIGVERAAAGRPLDVLCRAHLLREDPPGRFGMHDLLRAHAAEQAATRDDKDAALLRLFDHYLRAAETAETPDARAHWLIAERANLLAVAAGAVDAAPSYAVDLSARLERHLDTRGHYRDGLLLHGLALRAARTLRDRVAEADALVHLGTAYMRVGSYEKAIDHHRRALAIHLEIGNRAGEAGARHGLGTLAWRLGRSDEARAQLEAALAIRHELGDVTGAGAALYGLGSVYRQVGDYPAALDHQQRALAIYHERGDWVGESRVLNNLGTTFERMGRYAEAYEHYERALALNREIGNRLGAAVALTNLGSASARLGRYAEAVALHEQAVPLYIETGYRAGLADALHCLGEVCRSTGRHAEALDHLRRSVALAHEIGEAEVEIGALVDLGETLRAMGKDGDAATAYRSAVELTERTGDRYERARASSGLAYLSRATGAIDDARRGWQTAVTLYDALGVPQAAEVRELLAALDPAPDPDPDRDRD